MSASSRPAADRGPVVNETSAGGVCVDRPDPAAQVALIGRTDGRGRLRWCLPKGHLEPGETAEQAAVREVAEETGIEAAVIAPLGSLDYWFTFGGSRVHKVVHHFVLLAVGGELSAEDIEVTEVEWVPLAAAAARLAYPNERAIATKALNVLAGGGFEQPTVTP